MKIIDGHAMIVRVDELYRRGRVDLGYFNIVREAVQMQPEADAAPVVHGSWLCRGDFGPGWWECTACGRWCEARGNLYNYCPFCGAKMGGGKSHE